MKSLTQPFLSVWCNFYEMFFCSSVEPRSCYICICCRPISLLCNTFLLLHPDSTAETTLCQLVQGPDTPKCLLIFLYPTLLAIERTVTSRNSQIRKLLLWTLSTTPAVPLLPLWISSFASSLSTDKLLFLRIQLTKAWFPCLEWALD